MTGLSRREVDLVLRRDLNIDFKNVSKTTVIGIAAAATVLVIALISGCLVCFIRRRERKVRARRHRKVDSVDKNIDSPHDRVSKTPLMPQGGFPPMNEFRGVTAPRYDEGAQHPLDSFPSLHRTMSEGTIRSMPPSYTAATYGPIEGFIRGHPQIPHRLGSSSGGSDGLRPLMLVNSHDQDDPRGRSRSTSTTNPDRTPFVLARPADRPRAGSRFREEDLDM